MKNSTYFFESLLQERLLEALNRVLALGVDYFATFDLRAHQQVNPHIVKILTGGLTGGWRPSRDQELTTCTPNSPQTRRSVPYSSTATATAATTTATATATSNII
eukprot:1868516-Amphidinium_carterae.1